MTYKLTVSIEGTPRSAPISIPGLGTFKNGATYTISNEEADAFRTYQRDNGMPDRTLLQAFKGDENVNVEKTDEDAPEPKPTPETGTPPGDVSKTDTSKDSENSATTANKKDGDK
jgi:hypothetical protein